MVLLNNLDQLVLNALVVAVLTAGGLLSYSVIKVIKTRPNLLFYLLLCNLAPVAYLIIETEDVFGFIIGIFAMLFVLMVLEARFSSWVASHYEQVISDIPFFNKNGNAFANAIAVVLVYWFVASFFLAHAIKY